MAKPIALFNYPHELFFDGVENKTAVDIMVLFSKAMPDYYWLCFPAMGIRFPKLQVYFEKDMEEIQYDELVEMIKKKIEKLAKNGNQ